MPYHDLNLLHTTNTAQLNHTLAFATELGYKNVAVSTIITGKLPPAPPVPELGPLRTAHPSLKVLSRLTLAINDTSQNHRLSTLATSYDLIALRPLNEKSLQHCCSALDCDLISVDFTTRLPFILKFKTVSSALQRGIRFEINYSPSITTSSDAKRNLIAGATSLIRATRGRGIILSSEARDALGLRGPHDVMNLAQIWGLEQAKGKAGLVEEADKVVRLAALRRNSYRGVITIVDGGGPAAKEATSSKATPDAAQAKTSGNAKAVTSHATSNGVKRKASQLQEQSQPSSGTSTPKDASVDDSGKPLSKREMKRRAKRARLEGTGLTSPVVTKKEAETGADFPVKHETLEQGAKKKGAKSISA